MSGDGFEVLIEFTQTYDDGIKVLKRGLDATPILVRKYELSRNEVIAFSNSEGPRRAVTAFHFHPEFPDADRRAYMRDHCEGHDMTGGLPGERRFVLPKALMEVRGRALSALGGAVQVVSAIAIGFLNGHFR